MIMCELTSLFGDHSEINAAIIMTARAAFPEDPVYLIATHKHCEAVDEVLARYDIDKVFYEELVDKPTGSRTQLIRTVRSVFRLCRNHGCTRILIGGFDRRYHNVFPFSCLDGLMANVAGWLIIKVFICCQPRVKISCGL